MTNSIQESEVNDVLNKRNEVFSPKLGSFYGVEVGCGKKIKYATLTSIDYAHDFPYLCNVIVCKAIAINGDVKVPAKLAERRFDYSGVSEDGKSTLLNLSEEEKVNAKKDLDIDSLNWRSPKNVLEWVVLTDCGCANRLVVLSYVLALFSSVVSIFAVSDVSVLSVSAILSWSILCWTSLIMRAGLIVRASGTARKFRLIIMRICTFATIFLNTYAIVSLTESHKMDWVMAMPSLVFMFILLMVVCFYPYSKSRLNLNRARRSVFMIGNFDNFITGDGRAVVITNKFGINKEFPMEGYIVTRPEIRNGEAVIKEGATVPRKWNYNGHPNGYDEYDDEFDAYTLNNTPRDRKLVMDLFDEQCRAKSNSKTERVTKKADNGKSASENYSTLLSKITFVVNGLWSSKSGKVACFTLIAWAANFVFGYKLHDFLNYIIPALAVCLAMYGAKLKLKI